ncbi:CPBP family intramembrane metalloprotease [Pseudoxanthomonas gei]|uniref:CPBP family intramembrane metalloprotease n=1 Tax=Pseudoxanthomonas gei TaxID=1383030 RepID=A0ABX0AD67_9GAMM|nr:CPBP family intramembrane metalloprotease [Pseudoxanthomonas gei]
MEREASPASPGVALTGSVPPPRPGHRRALTGFLLDALIAVAVLLLVSVASGLAWVLVRIAQLALRGNLPADLRVLVSGLGQPGPLSMLWMTLLSTGTAALVVYYWRRRASAAELAISYSAVRQPSTWGWVLGTAAIAFVFSSTMSAVGKAFDIAPAPTNLPVIEAAFVASPVFMWLFGTLLAPAYEELLFRRVLFGRLWAAGRPWLGLLLSSAAFALMHEIPGTSGNSLAATGLLWLTYAFLGAAFGLVYWRTRTLWAAIAAHALNNAIALGLLKLYGVD